MTDEEARQALAALIDARREDYAGLSRLIGRNPAYIQQYVKRGTPRRLAERDRRSLARYFDVAESMLGGPADRVVKVVPAGRARALRGAELIAVPRLEIGASAGPGAFDGDEAAAGTIAFPAVLLRELGAGSPAALSVIRVRGNSMLPTLGDGDDILVDTDDGPARLRDGVYVVRAGEVLIVKRVAFAADGGLLIRSDNPAEGADWGGADPASLIIVGRVIWTGRRVG